MTKHMVDIGVIGLGVMGQNLVLNMNDHGYRVAVHNRTVSRLEEFLNGPARDTGVIGVLSLRELASVLRRPRRVLLMVKAGRAVDEMIDLLLPHLHPGDVLMDGGNSHFRDTMRRTADLSGRGFLYLGVGISGGEHGARHGPSIMPGGSPGAWPRVRGILQGIAARTADGTPCCDWVGENGAGHYVKMVHNGIEYSEMQLLCEAYHLMKVGIGLTYEEMHHAFSRWNRGPLEGYLVEITRDILARKDADGTPLVEKILDVAGQKGTGGWTGISSLELGVPLGMIGEAVYARFLSSLKNERVEASRRLKEPVRMRVTPKRRLLGDLPKALLASRVASYAQGFMLMRKAAAEYGWNLDFGRIAHLWRGGCIIRSALLEKMKEAFARNPLLPNLLLDPHFRRVLGRCRAAWRRVVTEAIGQGIPAPVFSAGLAFYDGYRTARLPAGLLQAQRDYFGAHTYERVDRPRGEFFHTEWKVRRQKVK
ncbi:MAG: decarboxylating NADP(+)-dependent phosphogluconate dehydrogenase [Thermodesulfobacteriota bacterium]